MKSRTAAAAISALLLLTAVGCGSSGSSGSTTTSKSDSTTTSNANTAKNPPAAQVSKALQAAFNLSQERGDCAAKKLEGTVSPEALQAVADSKKSALPKDQTDTVTKALQDALSACP